MYTIYSKHLKRRTESLCLTTETWLLILNNFSAYIDSLAFDLCRLTLNWTARHAHSGLLQTSNVKSNVKRWMPQTVFHQ